jgi:hypothetical protein
MPDGRIDTRFPRLRFPRPDMHPRSTLLHLLHRKGMVCARTFASLDSSLEILSLQLTPSPIAKAMRFRHVTAFTAPTRMSSRGVSLGCTAFDGNVILGDCMRFSKRRACRGTRLSNAL